MTPLTFEQRYAPLWDELDHLLGVSSGRKIPQDTSASPGASRARLAHLYRRSCEHLAIARARAYPTHLSDRLEDLTARAHQLIYHRADWGFYGIWRLITVTLPAQMRAHAAPLWVALVSFAGPLLVMGVLTYLRPALILSMLDAPTVTRFSDMYGDGNLPLGRTADTDWQMFGFYILNNISIAFQCFAAGILFGLGSLFYLTYNGALIGAVAGYLTARGLWTNFYPFVVTHSAFELSAIVLSGAAGLRLGYALLAPGRRTRLQSLVHAARGSVVIIYCATALLFIAAGIEAFWSSARWIPAAVKYGVGLIAWIAVLIFLCWPGHPRSQSSRP